MKTDLIIKMAYEINKYWDDINGVLHHEPEFYVHWLWKKYDKKVSYSDCFDAYKLAIVQELQSQ